MLHAGGNSTGLPSLSSLKDSFWNNSWQSGGGKASAIKSGSFGGDLKGGITSPGAASLMEGVGMPLAMSGLTGNRRGTWGGIAESTTGGALAGAGIGTMITPGIGTAIGAGVGAAAGFITGGLEKALGIVSPETKAKQQVKSLYNISINDGMAKQIADLAQSKYGGNVSIAVRDPETRKMLMLYAQSTGQKFPLSAGTPQAGYLAESGGNLYQQASYVNGVATTFQSSLPVLGGLGAGNYYPNANGPNTSGGAGGTSIALNINGQPITPEFVMDSSLSAQGSSYGRVQSAANLNVPGLMTGT